MLQVAVLFLFHNFNLSLLLTEDFIFTGKYGYCWYTEMRELDKKVFLKGDDLMSERKNIFWILVLILLIIAPIVILFTPIIVWLTLSDIRYKIVFIPLSASMVMYTLAFAIVIVWLCFMYFSKSLLINSATGVVAITGFIFIFSLGVQNYVYLHQDYIVYNPLWGSKEEFKWEEVTSVKHEMDDEEENRNEKYIFEFNDGYKFEFLVSGLVDHTVQSKIYNKLIKLNIPYKEY